jgi:hypothetical protein
VKRRALDKTPAQREIGNRPRKVQMTCRCSGRITAASILKRCCAALHGTPFATSQYARSATRTPVGEIGREKYPQPGRNSADNLPYEPAGPTGFPSRPGKYYQKGWINALRPSRPRSARRLRMRDLLKAIIGLPHGEERFGGAEARLEPRTLPIQRNSCSASPLNPSYSRSTSSILPRRLLAACRACSMRRRMRVIVFLVRRWSDAGAGELCPS